MARSKSSQRWLKSHFDDVYVKRAQRAGWRSRAVFKLEEIQRRDHILRPGMTVVDLGAAPGGWSQYAAGIVGGKGRVIALDILPMDPLSGVEFVRVDFRDEQAIESIMKIIGSSDVGLVMSDMAPNISGMEAVDQPRSMYLVELVVDFAARVLGTGGDLLVKVFQGEGFDPLIRELRGGYGKVVIRKPGASRPRSREVYVLAKGRRGPNVS